MGTNNSLFNDSEIQSLMETAAEAVSSAIEQIHSLTMTFSADVKNTWCDTNSVTFMTDLKGDVADIMRILKSNYDDPYATTVLQIARNYASESGRDSTVSKVEASEVPELTFEPNDYKAFPNGDEGINREIHTPQELVGNFNEFSNEVQSIVNTAVSKLQQIQAFSYGSILSNLAESFNTLGSIAVDNLADSAGSVQMVFDAKDSGYTSTDTSAESSSVIGREG